MGPGDGLRPFPSHMDFGRPGLMDRKWGVAPMPQRRPPTTSMAMPPLPAGTRLAGVINSYNPERGYGFLRCAELPNEDIYFHRGSLPAEARNLHSSDLAERDVDFDLSFTADGKPRTEKVFLAGHGMDDRFGGGFRDNGKGGREGRRRGGTRVQGLEPPPPLDQEYLNEMLKYLEEKGGAMDYGKFSNAFPGVKKSQLQDTFELVPEGSTSGGRWQITLKGVDPMTPEEREAKEMDEVGSTKTPLDNSEPLVLEPSSSLRLFGIVKKWNPRKGYGFVASDGYSDIFLHKNQLPSEVQSWNGSFEGCEMTFELEAGEDMKLKAVNAHLLLQPDAQGDWQLRMTNLDGEVSDEATAAAEGDKVAGGTAAAEAAATTAAASAKAEAEAAGQV